jgi:hypothetical protein
MKTTITLGMAVLLLGIADVALAGGGLPPIVVVACDDAEKDKITVIEDTRVCQRVYASQVVAKAPEIDPASAMAGMTMLLGGLAVLRGRRTKAKKDA